MKIDGRALAQSILDELKVKVDELKKRNITPHLAVVLIGNDSSSLSFIKQKKKAADHIGAKFTLHHFANVPPVNEVMPLLQNLSNDRHVHALIVQRPVPIPFIADELIQLVLPAKDVDGFHPQSPFLAPVAHAVWKIVGLVYREQTKVQLLGDFDKNFITWLSSKKLVLLGRGETAGKPIANSFKKHAVPFIQLHSQSTSPENALKEADIIVSAVGIPRTVIADHLKPGVVLVSVGFQMVNGKLKGDYEENNIESIASFYTPTPGGVGPVNVACLMQNVITAATS